MVTAPAPALPVTGTAGAGSGTAHWLRAARETADDLATDAATREQAAAPPFDEVSRLREAGLLPLLVPAQAGGGGADWRTAYAVVREIAAADGAIGQLLASHYFLSWSARLLAGAAAGARLDRAAARAHWCWGGGLAAREPAPTLTGTAGRPVLDGRRSCVGGALVADRLAVRAVRADTGEPVAVVVDPARPGVRIGGGTDTFGQRLAAGGSVEFDAVALAPDDVLGSLSTDEDVLVPPAAPASSVGRLLSAQVRLGLAEGVLAEAREYGRARPSRWHTGTWPDHTAADPQALTVFGELTVLTRSAGALADQAVDAVEAGLARGGDLSHEECAEMSVLVAMAEAAASRAAQECTARALDVVGVRSAAAGLGFDRFWRNARTHTLYEPVAHRLRDVGDYFLNGAHPPFDLPA
ncbi:acyl-CoA dehydrogenase family protein [Streptomyces sp. NPDC012461]|jgi:alkylation response protein AidB-like acyl-CoA dehydrogenase